MFTSRLLWTLLLQVNEAAWWGWWGLWFAVGLPLLAIPVWALYLHRRAERTKRLAAALLDITAQELGLIKLRAPKKFMKLD